MLCTDVLSNRPRYNDTWMANLRSLNLTQEDLQYLINITSFVQDDQDGLPNLHHQTDAGCYNCGGAVKSYSLLFREVHGYVSLFLCLFGALANALNIAVLTRKDLAGSPINRILCGLALADLALMVEYTPFTCYMYLTTAKKEEFSHVGAVYVLLHTYVSQVLHTTSIALTLVLAMWRYVVVK
uniref:G-protein coupled receptors family 1 profile domain-containing protein n=2 Tax=Schizaphis graminum TaxID=13262 RepID=A0A2S2NBN3_SCHGA